MPATRARLAATILAAALASAGLAVTAPSPADAATAFAAGDLVVYRVGDGSAALTSAATPAFLDEYTPAGATAQTVALPTAVSGTGKRLTASGTATSDGLLNLSADGRYLLATGYNTAPGTAAVTGTSSTTVSRTVGVVDGAGTVDTSTSLTDAFSGNNIRSAASVDGSTLAAAGAAASLPGLRSAARGATTSTGLVSNLVTSLRGSGVFGGQLYVSAPTYVATVGSGVPTTGSNAVTPLNFDTAPTNVYGFTFLSLGAVNGAPDTLYLADATAGVVKYSLSNGTWVRKGAVALSGVTGITANDVNGVAQIYVSAPTGVFALSDASGQAGVLTGSPTKIASAATNTAIRGIAFAPGTVIGSGPGTPPSVPTIATAYAGLPAALGDPTNPTDQVTVGDDQYAAGSLTVTARSSDQSVAADSGLTVSGSGATRTLTVTPGSVGTATITLTVTAPDGQTATTTVAYGVSADQGDASDRYYSGAGNASAAVDVGGGYLVVGDDESDVLRLYDQTVSGPPVATFDFTAKLPYGAAEVDIEGAARVGNTIYWTGSMSNNSKGNVAPARSTVFATTVAGSGASTTLSYAGAYTGLQSDLVAWDRSNGHGLGADYLGFDHSVNGGIANHAADSFNVEGLEFAADDPDTAYLAFRGPLEPTTDRHLALVVPVTDLPALVAGSASTATFGAPILWDLGGLGIRDIRRNADGDYLVLAGTATDANDNFALYTWDGDPADPPLAGQSVPLVPGGGQQGSWEAIAATPDPLADGAAIRLIEDNGTTAWYGDGRTQKSGLPTDLTKDLGRVITYAAPSRIATTTSLSAAPDSPVAGQTVTYTATVAPASGSTTPTGTVAFTDAGTAVPGCDAQPVGAGGTATCAVGYPDPGTHQVSAAYAGSTVFAPSTSDPLSVVVAPIATTIALSSDNTSLVTGQAVTFTARVTPADATGTVAFTFGTDGSGAALPGCDAVSVDASGTAQCPVPDGFDPGSVTVTSAYSGDGDHAASTSDPVTVTIAQADTYTAVMATPAQPRPGQDLTVTATVSPVAPGAGTPTGTATFTVTGPNGVVDCEGGDVVGLAGASATCTIDGADVVAGGQYDATVDYSGDAGFSQSTGSIDATVARVDTTTTVTSSKNPAMGGTLVTLRALVASGAGAPPGAPSGTVTFTVTGQSGTTVACKGGSTRTVGSNGAASCQLAGGSLVAGDAPYLVVADYSGDTQYEPSSGGLQQRVSSAPTKTVVTQSSARSAPGAPVTFTATVAATGHSTGTPSGDLTLVVTDLAGNPVPCPGGQTGSAPQVSCTVPAGTLTRTGNPYTVTATYAGDPDFAGSTGTARHKVTR